MELCDHPTDDQRAGSALLLPFFRFRDRNYRLHANSQVGDGAPYGQTESPNQVHERAPTSHEGDPGQAQGRPAASVPGDDEALSRPRRQSIGLPRSDVHSVPDLDRAVPVDHSNCSFQSGESCRSFATSVRMDSTGAWCNSHRQQFPVVRPCPTRPDSVRHAGSRWCFDVGNAEDDHNA